MRLLRLGTAAGIAVITALAFATVTRDSGVVLLVSAHTIVSFTALVVALINRRRLSSVVDRVRTAEPVVAAGLIDAPPVAVAELLAEVRQLGFELAGATDTAIDGPPIRTWILVEQARGTWVEVGLAGRPMAVFVSEVGTGRFIETAYPSGQPIDDPMLLSQVVTTDPAAALAAHREAVGAAGGPVPRVSMIDEYLAVESEHRARTGGMRIRAHLDRVIRPSTQDWGICLAVDIACLTALLFVPAPAGA